MAKTPEKVYLVDVREDYEFEDYNIGGVNIEKARVHVHQAIVSGQHVKTGEGRGPLNHFFDPQKLIKHEME